jgi:6-phosphofructokinase
MKIGIINSGGDAQGLNAVIAAAVKYGLRQRHEFVGFIKGWEGLLDKEYIVLDREAVRGISHLGGTILYTTNKGRFAGKAGLGDTNKIPAEILNQAKQNLIELGVEALIVIGGDGTLSGAAQLGDLGVKFVGVPKTIDNDLDATDATFGFHTAVDVALEALDRVHTTAYSHNRAIFVETMGRHAGWIALHAGLAGGAHVILLPEVAFSYEKLLWFMRTRKQTGERYTIIVVAEGAHAADETVVAQNVGEPEVKLGGISEQIIDRLNKLAPGEFEMRNLVLGHVQRGGAPNAIDRILAKSYGVAAIDAIDKGLFGHVVCLQGNAIRPIPLDDVIDRLKTVTRESYAYQTAQKIGVYFGH